MKLIDRPIHCGLDAGRRSPLFVLANQDAFEPRDHAIYRVAWITLTVRFLVILDRAVDVDHFFAVRTPFQNLVEKCAFALTFGDKIDCAATSEIGMSAKSRTLSRSILS